MDDQISRQAALIAIRNLYPDMPRVKFMDNISNWQKRNKQYIECENEIENLPSAQKTGKWLVAKGACEPDYMECNKCKWITEYYGGLEEEWDYCPHCGARMEMD